MKRQRTAVLGLVMAATLAFPAVAGAAGFGGATQVGSTGVDSLMPPPIEQEVTTPPGSAEVQGTQIVRCECLTHRVPTPDSPLEAALS